jgi:peptidoglycan L-alanyl-D-glutamate endopeptidase CwlK
MASRKIQDCVKELQDVWEKSKEIYLDKYSDLPQPFLTCTYRSLEEQRMLYNQSFDGIDNDNDGKIDEPDEKVTNAKPGQSKHNLFPSKAFDIAFKKNGIIAWDLYLFLKFAEIVKEVNPNIKWGGNWKFKDYPHFEID